MQLQLLKHHPYTPAVALSCSLILGMCLKEPLVAGWHSFMAPPIPAAELIAPRQMNELKSPGYDQPAPTKDMAQLFADADALFDDNVDAAIAAYKAILTQDNSSLIGLVRLGTALCKKEQYDLAEFYYRIAVSLQPGFILAYIKLGLVQQRLQKFTEAIRTFNAVIMLQPDNFEAHFSISKVYSDAGDYAAAIKHAQRAIELSPRDVHTHLNLGHIFNKQGDTHAAIKLYEKAIEVEPGLANAHYNLGYTLRVQREPHKALPYLFKALELQPYYPDAHIALAQAYWTFGDFATAWEHYDWRWKQLGVDPHSLGIPLWNGSPLEGKTIFLYAEQGLGDTLQFVRYAKQIKKMGATVVCKVQRPLETLLKSCPFIDKLIVSNNDQSIHIDTQAPLLNLPGILKTTPQTIPHPIPYLFADKKLAAQWKQRLAADKKFKVGLAWHVLPEHELAKSPLSKRSIPLKLLAPLAAIPNVSFYSLQKFDGVDQILDLPEKFVVKTFGGDFDETNGRFMDTAALIENLDLIISVDTSIIHLAAAMGKPVFTLLPFSPDCRWDLNEDTTPWYKNMRLFRQQTYGDWNSVVKRVGDALKDVVLKRGK